MAADCYRQNNDNAQFEKKYFCILASEEKPICHSSASFTAYSNCTALDLNLLLFGYPWSCPMCENTLKITQFSPKTHTWTAVMYKHTPLHLPRAKQNPCTSHLIPFIVQRKDSSVTNAPVSTEASGNSQSFCCFRASCQHLITLTPCTYPLLCTLFLSVFLTSALLFFFLLPCLSDLVLSLVRRLHNAHQLFRGSLPVSSAYPIRVRLCTNGLLLYLLQTPAGGGGGGGGDGEMEGEWEE